MKQRDAKAAQTINLVADEPPAIAMAHEVSIDALADIDIKTLVSFFKLLDRWDRERQRNAKTM